MARRRKADLADDLMELVSMLPWWAGVALAIIAYALLHYLAGRPVMTVTQPGQMSSLVIQTWGKTLASIGQYVVPLICLAGAGVSAWRRRERKALVGDVAQSQASNALDGMAWREFEVMVGEAFRLQGYQVSETGGGGADGGVDLVLSKGNEKFFVQCKQWKAFKVGVDVVRELYGVMAARGATGGFVVTSGRFTDDATAFALGRNVKLVDGPKLLATIRQVQPSTNKAQPQPTSASAPVPPSPAVAPALCPVCAKTMIQRTAKRGIHAGNAFWGCSAYPACRGTRQIA